MKTLIIAEAGVNHNGDMVLAKELVSVAADAGADLVKFQSFNSSKITSQSAPKAEYQKTASNLQESQQEMLARLELTRENHLELIDECKKKSIGFLSTPFGIDGIELLEDIGQSDIVKVPSGELTNLPFLRRLSLLGERILISTGMANLGEIEAAIEVFEKAGRSREQITILHCVTSYPASMEEVNLLAMVNIGTVFGMSVGYSDHTLGIEVATAAVALGATVIEKHFTLNQNFDGPDHRASLEPDELKAMVQSIRNIEIAMGDGIKRPSSAELTNRSIVRSSIIASRPIKSGEIFSEENLTVKRPGTGISPMRWDDVVGRVSSRDFDTDEMVEL